MTARRAFIWPDIFNIGVAPPVDRGANALSIVTGARAFNSIIDNLPQRYQSYAMGLLDPVFHFPISQNPIAVPFNFPPNMPLLPNPYAPFQVG